jgi:cobalt-zinc-cadmium efflux system outer membrane protein
MRRLLPALLWAALFFPLSSVAQQAAATAASASAETLTLRDAQAAAWARHPALLAAQREVEISEAARIQAGARPNPTLSAEVEDTRRATRTTTLLLAQPIELGGKRSARMQASERSRDLALATLNERRAEVRGAVTAAFFDVLIAQEREQLASASLKLAQRGTQAVGNRVTAGKVSPIEETRARLAEATVRMEALKARSELATARQRLAAAMGAPTATGQMLQGTATALPAEPDLAQLEQRWQQSPARQRARAEVDRAAALVDIERGRQTPDVTLSVGARRDADAQRSMAVVGVSIPLPFFDTNRGALLASQRRLDQARDELALADLRIQTELEAAAEQWRTARAEATSLQREVLPAAQSAHDATAAGYELGKFGLLEVLDAQRSLLQARTQYLQALSVAHRAAVDVERLLGEPGVTSPTTSTTN